MPRAHPRGPNDRPSFWQLFFEMLGDEDPVGQLIRLIMVAGPMLVAILCAAISVYYIGTQHFPLWGKFVIPGGGVGVSVLSFVFQRVPKRSSGTALLGQRGSAGEIPQEAEGGEHPSDDPGEQ